MTPQEIAAPALELRDLDIAYRVRGRNREVVRTVSLSIAQGECYGLVGESGCGKSTVALAIARYLPSNGIVTGGGISVAGTDVLPLRGESLRAYHRDTFSMVYQNPGTALNPTLRVSRQLTEVFELRGVSRAAGHGARDRRADGGQDRRPGLGDDALSRTSSRAACSSAS